MLLWKNMIIQRLQGFSIVTNAPVAPGGSLEIPKVVLQTSDKIQAQSDNSSGNLTVALQLLTDIA